MVPWRAPVYGHPMTHKTSDSPRSPYAISLTLVALAIVLVPRAFAVPAPNLLGTYRGSYVRTGQVSAESFEIEVEKQHGRRLRVSIFASNEPEFRGRAKLMRDDVTLALHTRATGRGAARLSGNGEVTDGGAAITGTFLIQKRGVTDRDGTFSVAR